MAIKKASVVRKQDSYGQMSLRMMARQHSEDLIQELSRIALGRRTFDQHVVEFTKVAGELLTQFKRRKISAPDTIEDLRKLISKVTAPPSDSDIIKSSDILLNRGWGRPTTETLDFENYLGMDPATARDHVQAALVARAIQGDVSAQQAFLRLPTQIEVGILGDEELDASQLNDEEMAIFLSLIEKMKPRPSESDDDEED